MTPSKADLVKQKVFQRLPKSLRKSDKLVSIIANIVAEFTDVDWDKAYNDAVDVVGDPNIGPMGPEADGRYEWQRENKATVGLNLEIIERLVREALNNLEEEDDEDAAEEDRVKNIQKQDKAFRGGKSAAKRKRNQPKFRKD